MAPKICILNKLYRVNVQRCMAVSVIGTTGAVYAVPFALGVIGFGQVGVTGGSMAAAAQSAFCGGAVQSGGLFATLQSIGAGGLSTQASVALVAAAVAAGCLEPAGPCTCNTGDKVHSKCPFTRDQGTSTKGNEEGAN